MASRRRACKALASPTDAQISKGVERTAAVVYPPRYTFTFRLSPTQLRLTLDRVFVDFPLSKIEWRPLISAYTQNSACAVNEKAVYTCIQRQVHCITKFAFMYIAMGAVARWRGAPRAEPLVKGSGVSWIFLHIWQSISHINPFNASCSKLLLFEGSVPYWSNPPF